jgi:two-component system, NarL family, invasion response regulator UvrY
MEETALPHEKLSGRELEIFRLIALGRAVKEIAGDLGLRDKTVATYLGRIREKTGLAIHVDIARYALQNRLVD